MGKPMHVNYWVTDNIWLILDKLYPYVIDYNNNINMFFYVILDQILNKDYPCGSVIVPYHSILITCVLFSWWNILGIILQILYHLPGCFPRTVGWMQSWYFQIMICWLLFPRWWLFQAYFWSWLNPCNPQIW